MIEYMPVDDGLCAVEGCGERGHLHICPYDGRYHHHGKIHYEAKGEAGLTFKQGAWRGLCHLHFHHLLDALNAR